MPFIDRNQIIQAVAAEGADKPLTEGIRRWRPHRSPQDSQSAVPDGLIHGRAEDGVAIMDHESPWMVESQEFSELLRGPLRRRMVGDIAMENPARADFHRHEDKQHPKGGGHGNEEIAGDGSSGVIV